MIIVTLINLIGVIVSHSGKERMLDERDVYSLTQIEQDIEDLESKRPPKKYRIDMKYIELL